MEDLIIHGDVYAGLQELPDNAVRLAITSPPYWRQRDYGFEGQVGRESTPEAYIGRLSMIFDLLREKLTDDGVFFLNVGDKYLPKYGKSHLLQLPYRLASEMVRRGWHLLDVLIWYKPNHMPSPAKDRFTNTYEPVLVFSKSPQSIYVRKSPVLKIRLEQTPWKHTAVFPESLVRALLERVRLKRGDIVLDPFAGTGTVAVVISEDRGRRIPEIGWIMVEGCEEFVSVILSRVGPANVMKVYYEPYEWSPVEEIRLPEVEPLVVTTDPRGEVHIVSGEEFTGLLKGMTTSRFKEFHREDALYLFGVKDWSLEHLCYPAAMLREGYVLRNMLVSYNSGKWFPIFVFARDTKRVRYRFDLDALRLSPKTEAKYRYDPRGMEVRDAASKRRRRGVVVEVVERYEDGFPRVAVVEWFGGERTAEAVVHPSTEPRLRFRCPRCGDLVPDYDPLGENMCLNCGLKLWESEDTLPLVEEGSLEPLTPVKLEFNGSKVARNSKFLSLDRENWGASPGARKLVLGDFFIRTRLYNVEQPIFARYLNILRKAKGLTIKDVASRFPPEYKHTVGHWFRRDFGGSLPLIEDVRKLKGILGPHPILDALIKTGLRYSTVRPHPKGRNPGDFIEGMNEDDLMKYLAKLYI